MILSICQFFPACWTAFLRADRGTDTLITENMAADCRHDSATTALDLLKKQRNLPLLHTLQDLK